jgi:DNA polymerase-3 subunit alpha
MDFLGLATLTVIKNAVSIIRRRGGAYAGFAIENIPENDAATFKLFKEGQTASVFQFESDGMQNILKQAKPDKIEDLFALNALYRPGPMDNIPQFVKSKNGEQSIRYPDPCLEDILKETYGVIVYQEQVMQVAQRIAGYSLGEADLLRRAMGKKKMEVMQKEKEKFIKGALERGFSESTADDIFVTLVPFAGYGFNKSHAAAYSILAYQTAYLKANFPHEFMAASLTNVLNDPDKLVKYIDEVRDIGIQIDPPDINRSEKLFTVDNGRIVYGFLGIKGVGDGPSEAIIAGRAEGPYKDFMDFLERVDLKAVGKKVIELLIQTGAFDCFNMPRAALGGNMERAVEYTQKKKEDKLGGQESLFGDTNEKEYADFVFTNFPEWSRDEKLRKEKELIGFYFSGHPLDVYKDIWQKAVKLDLANPAGSSGAAYTLLGQIRDRKKIISRSGSGMGFASLVDFKGEIEVTFFSSVWERYGHLIENDAIVCIKGKYDDKRGKPSILADEVVLPDDVDTTPDPLNPYEAAWKQNVKLNLAKKESLVTGDEQLLIGEIMSLRPVQVKNGKSSGEWMAFGTLRDFNGEIDLTFFSAAWEKNQEKVEEHRIVAVKGKVDKWKDKISFKVSKLVSLDRLAKLAEGASSLEPAGKTEPVFEPPTDVPQAAPSPTAALQPTAATQPEAVYSYDGVSTEAIWVAENAGYTYAGGAQREAAAAGNTAGEGSRQSEVHIRLQSGAARAEHNLISLRNVLSEHGGGCDVFIHIPEGGREAVIRTSKELTANASATENLRRLSAVAEVWCA